MANKQQFWIGNDFSFLLQSKLDYPFRFMLHHLRKISNLHTECLVLCFPHCKAGHSDEPCKRKREMDYRTALL